MHQRLSIGFVGLFTLVFAAGQAAAGPPCDRRVNNTAEKLLECVTLEGVRAHQAAFQAIADANNGVRSSGTPGYDASLEYVSDKLEGAGYDVTIQPFEYFDWFQLGPSTLEQTAPLPVSYAEGSDYRLMTHTEPGDVLADVTAVDLQLGLGNASTSGCEIADFAVFPPGNIALIQRGACTFQLKAENAAAAGAVGVIIFNQGNTPERFDAITGTLGAGYSGGVPVVFSSYPLAEGWAATPGLTMHLVADVFRGDVTSYNLLAETSAGDPDNVVVAGAHLDSVVSGPGIQDNGSGSAALLEVALQMAKVKPRNRLRFAWWGAEEAGRVGSTFYVDNLAPDELDTIALYLNFDEIGSPNFVRFVYDGDGSESGSPGPSGSEAIEALFEGFYADAGLAFEPTALLFGSDHFPFVNSGIPVGGVTTGNLGIKTPEQAALYGGTAGDQYDPCYHLACDTFDNISLQVLDLNADAVAFAVLQYAMNTEAVNGKKGKGNFKPAKKK